MSHFAHLTPAAPITKSDPKSSNSNDVVLNMKSLTSGIFSDLTITCQGREFKLHKLVLYTQSTYFRKLLGGQFKECSASIIDFPDDSPEVLEVMFHYFYHFVLDVSKPPTTTSPSQFVVQIYAIADKYDVPKLRTLAAQQLNKTCNPTTDITDFLCAIRAVDAFTVGKALWDILKPKIRANIALLCDDKGFCELLMEPEFRGLNFELLRGLGEKGSGKVGSTWELPLAQPVDHLGGGGRRLG